MVRNPEILEQFENSLIASSKPDLKENLRIAEALFEHACRLGVFPLREPLEGLEIDIQLAKILNRV